MSQVPSRGVWQAAAMSATYRVISHAAALRNAAADFWQQHAKDPDNVTGDYVSDLVAELRGHLADLQTLVAEIDAARVMLDAASFPVAGE